MRELFGAWGARLDDPTFYAAVAGRIVELGYVESENERFDSLAATFDALKSDSGIFRFGDWASVRARWETSRATPDELAAAWLSIADSRPALVTPDLEPARGIDAEFALAVLDSLARGAARSVVARVEPTEDVVREWRWPLRVGVLPADHAHDVHAAVSHHAFLQVGAGNEGPRDWDVLFFPVSLPMALAELSQTLVRARVVVVSGDEAPLDPAAVPATLAALRALSRAQALVLGRVAASSSGALLRRLADEIAHDLRFDNVVFSVVKELRGAPLLVGEHRFLESTYSSLRLKRIGDKLVSVGAEVSGLPPPSTLPGLVHVANGGNESTAASVGEVIVAHAAMADFENETEGATGTAILSQLVDDVLAPEAAKAAPRFLHTGAKPEGAPENAPFVNDLQTGDTYELFVWIGPLEKQALSLGVAFPDLENPQETHELTVVLNEPRLLSEPQLKKLRLPPVGKSKPCSFVIHCSPRVTRIEARIAILHRGRVLQTGVLRGRILKAGESPTPKSKLGFGLDAAPRRRLQTLSSRSRFDAALIANHDDHGTPGTLGMVGERVARIKLNDATLNALTTRFNVAVSDIASQPASYKTLRSKGTITLLRELAQHGARLHEVIENHSIVGPALAKAERLQIVTARVDGFLPLELAYRYEAPEDTAKLCKGAEAALKKGKCPKSCGKVGGTDARICPLGFWGLSRTIERFSHVPAHVAEDSDFSLFAEPLKDRNRIPRPKAGVVAASALASAEDKQAVKRVETAVDKHAKLVRAKDWDEWITNVRKSRPELLVLLPHHVSEGDESILEIGKSSRLKATLVKRKHLVGSPEPDPAPRPVVLLLGCETHDSPIAFERFPSMFAERGAAIVVATIATVLGRHASPAAVDLISEIYRSSPKPKSFGDFLLAARRRLLANGRAMCLALVGFGDADWQL
jgi:hypothetical protein